jgi:hypothetical protein
MVVSGSAFALALLLAAGPAASAPPPEARFTGANELARSGDYPKALAGYRALAAAGFESASLYWNWAQVASARGETGEALWALLRARELDPADRAVGREIESVRRAAHLDPAEVSPDPLASVARLGRRWHLGLAGLLLIALSLGLHLLVRAGRSPTGASLLAWSVLVLGLLVALPPLAGGFARPTAVVVTRGASLLDAASPSARTLGSLREAEVVPILEASGPYLRIEDSSGARGWARVADVRPLSGPPSP